MMHPLNFGVPLTRAPDPESAPVQVAALAHVTDGRLAAVVGTVIAVDSRVTGQGNPWSVVTVADDSGFVDCLVYPAPFREFAEQLVVGETLLVRGRLDRRQAPARLVAMTVTAAPL